MEIVRYADRDDLLEIRSEVLNTFPTFMNHNAMGWKYWGRLYELFPDFQLALLDDGDLIAEVHSLPVHVDASCRKAGTRRSSAAWSSATATSSRCLRSVCARTGAAARSRCG